MNMTEYRREYKRRWTAVKRARDRGFDDHRAALVALKLVEYGLAADEVREALYLAARDGAFGLMNKIKNQIKQEVQL